MARLRLALMGPMQVILDGQPVVTFPYEKVRALFAYLATESHHSHHRDTLAAMFWADQCESKARSNLRKALSILRQLLGDTAESAFLTTRNTIQFNPDPNHHQLDIAMITQLLEHAPEPANQTDKLQPQRVSELEQAVALYRGPFLDQMQLASSEAFESWLILHRERFHQLIINACSNLINHYEYQKDYQKVKQYVQRQLHLEPWNEAAHQRLIQILIQQGQRTAALRQYDRCCQILEREWATAPEPETIALGEAIRSGRLSKTAQLNAGSRSDMHSSLC